MTPVQTSLFDQPKRAYHNTLPIAGKELREAEEITGRQDKEVLLFFQEVVAKSKELNYMANSWEVCRAIPYYAAIFPKLMVHASVKRAMTNLKEAGHLIRTNIRRKGEFKSASCYQLKPK